MPSFPTLEYVAFQGVKDYITLFRAGFGAWAHMSNYREGAFERFPTHAKALAKGALAKSTDRIYMAALIDFERLINSTLHQPIEEPKGYTDLLDKDPRVAQTLALLKPAIRRNRFKERYFSLADKYGKRDPGLLAFLTPELELFGWHSVNISFAFQDPATREQAYAGWKGHVMDAVRPHMAGAITDLENRTGASYREACDANNWLLMGFEYYQCLIGRLQKLTATKLTAAPDQSIESPSDPLDNL